MYDYGLIGNCQTAALVSKTGAVDWLCLPRPDSQPVFGRLLDADGGSFAVDTMGRHESSQRYLPNTNVLVTRITTEDGGAFTITDFCPRFEQHGRMYRPIALFRVVEPEMGNPTIRVACRPVNGWEKEPVKPVRGNSHLRYEIRGDYLRLVTNMPLTYLCDESPFVLTEPLYFGLTWSLGVEEDLINVTKRFLKQTVEYWRTWVKHCSIPSLYQKDTIRSALALKLHCYEDTGAILAALTTSLPEQLHGNRNWDYRYCWLRDAAFALTAFNNLGHFDEMEGFLRFLLNIAHRCDYSREHLSPVYCLDQSLPLPETEHPGWTGYQHSKPVRSHNQAAEYTQNDVYGEMILALSPIFFDERFQHLRTKEYEELLAQLAEFCIRSISMPDAGLWELRSGWQEHSFTNLMCWAGIERTIRMRDQGFLQRLEVDLLPAKAKAERAVESATKAGSLRNGPKDDSFDSALLLLPVLRYPNARLCDQTVGAIAQELRYSANGTQANFLYRYTRPDDFGRPASAFLLCSFWLAQAHARLGKMEQARQVMADALLAGNHLGLVSEHYSPDIRQQRGNFPQAYSHVGQINAAFAISPSWDQIL